MVNDLSLHMVPQLLAPDVVSEEGNKGRVRDFDAAVAAAGRLQDIFGRDGFFIEIQDHGMEAQRRVMGNLLDLCADSGRYDATNGLARDLWICAPFLAAGTDFLSTVAEARVDALRQLHDFSCAVAGCVNSKQLLPSGGS